MRLIRRTSDRAQDETGAPRRILVADDDPSIATLIQVTLKDPRYEIVAVKNGLEALKEFEGNKFDVVILDVMMPYVDGFEACQRIRERSDVPIIILTSRDGTEDVVQGFEHRVAPPIVRVGDLEIDEPRHRVAVRGQNVNLTPMEFELLYFLAANSGQVFDRETLFREVWGYDYVGETNLVDVCVRRLREKVEVEPSRPRMIATVRGVGYKMAEG